ncbi:response regulator receiver domain [Pseudomonas umsongensis]|uniref:response regulator receiver domain n=1 Tax=Pseudomonas umsongensis TaxID=198618 RepID=UPI003ECE20CB
MSEVLAVAERILPVLTLKDHYKECVRKFLKTVVVVDDRAYKSAPAVEAVVVETPVSPLDALSDPISDGSYITQVVEPGTKQANEEDFGLAVDDKDHELDGPGLVRLFASQGIICSIIEPDSNMAINPLVDEIKSISQAADVLVLDWELRPGDHTASLTAIHEIVMEDAREGGRLRFIVVYTASKQRTVKKLIKERFGAEAVKVDGNLMKVGHATIVVLNKPSTAYPDGVPLSQLPDRIIDLHSELSAGVLPAAALSAIGTIRNHTHQVLGQFKESLDAAFITHRALIPKSDDAEAHLIELVADSLHNLMLTEGVRAQLSDKLCIERLRELRNVDVSEEATLVIEECLSTYRTDKLSTISAALEIDRAEKHPQKRIMEKFYPTPAGAEVARKEMAFLHDFTRSHLLKLSSDHPPRLSLGTVVARAIENGFEYFLCIQPRCDSIRFQNVRSFPLMKLSASSSSPNIHLQWDGNQRSFSVSEKLYDILTFEFGSIGEPTQAVIGSLDEECSKWFFSDGNGSKLYWVGDLRREKAQRLVSKIASRLHLPGINEYEPTRVIEE